MGIFNLGSRKEEPTAYDDPADREYDESGAWHYREGSEGERRAIERRKARWDAAEKRDREDYKKSHDHTSVANRPQVTKPTGKVQVQQKQLTPQQAIQIAKLQLKAQQQAAKNNRRNLRTAPLQYQLYDTSNGFAAFNYNVGVGVQNTVRGLNGLTNNIAAYNRDIANFDMNFGYDTIDVNLSNYNDRLNDLNKRLMQMLW